jgi:hypothetical protein
VGVGTTTPNEKLDIENATSGGTAFLKIETSHASAWGEAGLRIKTPQNRWDLRMDDDSNNDLPAGALGLTSQGAGAEVVVFTEAGDVGIGKTSPGYRLDVESNASAVQGTSTTGGYGVSGNSSSGTGVYGYSATGYGCYFHAPKHYMNGLLGLATTTPSHRLTVNGAIGIQSGGDTEFHVNYYNGGLNFSETNVADYRLNIEAGGNVGIGTGDPQEKLHVAGNAQIDGTLYTDGFEDNSINKDDILDDPGVASSEAQGAFLVTTSWNDLSARTITTPADGYVLAIGSFGFNAQHLASGVTSGLIGISTSPDSVPAAHRHQIQIPALADYGDYKMPGACQRVFTLPEGTHTIYLVGRNTGDNFLTVGPVSLVLLFVPTNYGTVSTAAAQAPVVAAAEDPAPPAPVPAHSDAAFRPQRSTGQLSEDQRITVLMAEVESLRARLEALEQD